jgi:hypothetical protein
MAEELEFAAKRGDLKMVLTKNDAFIRAVQTTISGLRSLCSSASDEGSQQDTKSRMSPDEALLEKLLGYCIRYDMKGMEEILSELERYTYENRGELVTWLREQLDNLEYGQILERLENIGIGSPLRSHARLFKL